MKILLVEDNFLASMHLEEVLRCAGHQPIGPFATAEDALGALAGEDVDGALLDYSIRGGTSLPVALELARRCCPFVFITGYGGATEVPAPFDNVARLPKPFVDEDVIRAVERFRRGG